MSVKFDRFRLSLPSDKVIILKTDEFTHTISKDGMETHHKYEQKLPFYYQILVDVCRCQTYLEFSGKALLDNYPLLISSTNITECFININNYKICYIDPVSAIEHASVCQCDVTADISYTGSLKDLHNNLIIRNNRDYAVTTLTSNRFAIQNTLSTPRKRERLIVYDKAEEIKTKANECFLQTISNRDEQLEYFADKVRLELNLNSVDRIRKYLGVSDTSLLSVLNSHADPIGSFLCNALSGENTIEQLRHHTPKLRNMEHLLLMCLCDFNLSQLERVIRDVTGKSYSITNTLAPYKVLYESVKKNVTQPEAETYFIELRNLIKWAVSKTLSTDTSFETDNLIYLYTSQQSHDYDTASASIPSIFDVCMPRLPQL